MPSTVPAMVVLRAVGVEEEGRMMKGGREKSVRSVGVNVMLKGDYGGSSKGSVAADMVLGSQFLVLVYVKRRANDEACAFVEVSSWYGIQWKRFFELMHVSFFSLLVMLVITTLLVGELVYIC